MVNLNIVLVHLAVELIVKQHGDGVGLFSGGAAGHPDTDIVALFFGFKHLGQRPFQGLKRIVISEKPGH